MLRPALPSRSSRGVGSRDKLVVAASLLCFAATTASLGISERLLRNLVVGLHSIQYNVGDVELASAFEVRCGWRW